MSDRVSSIFEMVAERRLTPEDGAAILTLEDELNMSHAAFWLRRFLEFAWP